MKKIHWFLYIQLLCSSLVYSAERYEDLDRDASDYIIISNVDDLNLFIDAAKKAWENNDPLTDNIILSSDIDLGYYFDGTDCRSKGDSSPDFFNPIPLVHGVFDGNNYTISGLCIQQTEDPVGFFTQHAGTIKNLKIDRAYIQGNVAGAVVGEGLEEATITNIHVSNSTIIGSSAVGGLAGKQVFNISNSSVTNSNLKLQSNNESGDIGGLVGHLVTTPDFFLYSIEQSFVKNTSFSSLPKQNIGGLIGSIQSEDIMLVWGSISQSFVESDFSIPLQSNLGGLIGLISVPSSTISIYFSYFKGNMTSTNTNDDVSYIGGLVGRAEDPNVTIYSSYQMGAIRSKSKYKGLFIGSIENGHYTIESVYSVSDSILEPVGYYIESATAANSFSGFIADDKNGEDVLAIRKEDGEYELKTRVKSNLLKQRSAAYLLNKAGGEETWIQIADSNDGYPFLNSEFLFKTIYQVTLINDTSNKTDTTYIYSSPLTGKIDPEDFTELYNKYPSLVSIGNEIYSFEEKDEDAEFTGNSLTPQTSFNYDIIFYLVKTNRYAIHYDLETDTENNFVFWINDSITNFTDIDIDVDINKSELLRLPLIAQTDSCFLGWNTSTNRIDYSEESLFEIDWNKLFDDGSYSDLYLRAVWGESSIDCKGINTTPDIKTPISIDIANGTLSLLNNGKRIPLTSNNTYYFPKVVDQRDFTNPLSIPIIVKALPKSNYKLDSLYFINSNFNVEFISDFIYINDDFYGRTIYAIFKSTTGASDPLYTITYEVPNKLNDSIPALFLSETYPLEYNSKPSTNNHHPHLPELVKADSCFNGWVIKCTESKTCTQSGYVTDSYIMMNSNDGFWMIPEGFEGNITLTPLFSTCNDHEKPPIVQVEIKPQEHGYVKLLNNGREILSQSGFIKYPVQIWSEDTIAPPLRLIPVPDSAYDIRNVSLQSINSLSIVDDFSDSFIFANDVSITPHFYKIILTFGPHLFTQKGGAFTYQGSIEKIDAKGEVSVRLLIQNKDATYKDSLTIIPVKTDDTISFDKINLPLGDLKFSVSLRAVNTVVSKEFDFFVDSTLQFMPSSWQMISLANMNPSYEKSRDEVFFGWNDTTALGDFWQYQELYSTDQIEPSHGYWYQSLNETSIPLKVNNSSSVTRESMVSWGLVSGQTGWNLIANPYHWPISLNVKEEDDSTAFWKWNDTLGAYDRVYHLESHGAAWVQVSENKKWETTAAPFLKPTEAVVPKRRLAKTGVSSENWSIQLKLKNALGKQDAHNFIGVGPKASSLKEPPQGMGSFVNLSILKNKERLAEQILSAKNSIWRWDILLSSSDNDKASLEMEGVTRLLEMGYKVVLKKEGEIIEVKENTPIHINTKQAGTKATITVMPKEQFALASKIDQLLYYKQGSGWKIQFNAGIALDHSKAVVSLYNLKGSKLKSSSTPVNVGLNDVFIEDVDFAGIILINMKFYDESGKIIYQHQQKLLEKY